MMVLGLMIANVKARKHIATLKAIFSPTSPTVSAFFQNREIREINVSRKFHVIRYTLYKLDIHCAQYRVQCCTVSVGL